MRIFGAVFWAVILIVIGIVIILNQVFDWNLNVFAIIFGVILIFVGISLVTGPSKTGVNGVFAGGQVRNVKEGDNSFVFSGVELDLADTQYDNIEINSIFSSVKVHTSGRSVKIESNGAFSNTVFPDNTSLAFGERVYERDGENTIHVKTNCVFGTIVID